MVERIPFPEYVIALGETQQAAGRMAAAKASYALVGVEAKLLRANGVNTDVDLALFEANHGSARARRGAGAEGVDGGAQRALGRRLLLGAEPGGSRRGGAALLAEAMKLGSRDPFFLYHAGLIAGRAGFTTEARGFLSQLVEQSPRFSPLYGPRAQRALEALG